MVTPLSLKEKDSREKLLKLKIPRPVVRAPVDLKPLVENPREKQGSINPQFILLLSFDLLLDVPTGWTQEKTEEKGTAS